jgi:hypothetical protein
VGLQRVGLPISQPTTCNVLGLSTIHHGSSTLPPRLNPLQRLLITRLLQEVAQTSIKLRTQALMLGFDGFGNFAECSEMCFRILRAKVTVGDHREPLFQEFGKRVKGGGSGGHALKNITTRRMQGSTRHGESRTKRQAFFSNFDAS